MLRKLRRMIKEKKKLVDERIVDLFPKHYFVLRKERCALIVNKRRIVRSKCVLVFWEGASI